MIFLLFFLSIIQSFTYWIFEPSISFLTGFIELKLFPGIALMLFLFLFSAKDKNKI